MSLGYVIWRLFIFLLVIWAAMTLIFFLPKLVPGRDPVMERMTMLMAGGGIQAEGIQRMVEAYRAEFGLEEPLYVQYIRNSAKVAMGYRGERGYSNAGRVE